MSAKQKREIERQIKVGLLRCLLYGGRISESQYHAAVNLLLCSAETAA